MDGSTVHFPPGNPNQKGPWIQALQTCSLLSNLQFRKQNLHLPTCYGQLEPSTTPPFVLPLQLICQHILSSLPPESHPHPQRPHCSLLALSCHQQLLHDYGGLLIATRHSRRSVFCIAASRAFPFSHSFIQQIFPSTYCVPGTVFSGSSLVIKIS